MNNCIQFWPSVSLWYCMLFFSSLFIEITYASKTSTERHFTTTGATGYESLSIGSVPTYSLSPKSYSFTQGSYEHSYPLHTENSYPDSMRWSTAASYNSNNQQYSQRYSPSNIIHSDSNAYDYNPQISTSMSMPRHG